MRTLLGKAARAALSPLGLTLARTSSLNALIAQVAGYKAAYEEASARFVGYKGAYEAVSSQLSASQVQSAPVTGQLVPAQTRDSDGESVSAGAIEAAGDSSVAETPSPEADFARLADADLYDTYGEYGRIFSRRLADFRLFPRYADQVASALGSRYPYKSRSGRTEEAARIAACLRSEGLYRMGPALSRDEADEVVGNLDQRPCLPGHIPNASVDRKLRYRGGGADRYFAGCYRVSDIVTAPHLLRVALDPFLLDVAAAYLGCIPTLTWLQAWWSFPNPAVPVPGSAATAFHRDQNDYRMFWVYLYLTDTDTTNGAHYIIRRSDDGAALAEELARARIEHPELQDQLDEWPAERMLRSHGYDIPGELKEVALARLVECIVGERGSLFLSTGINFHKIQPPSKAKRLMFAARFQLHGGPEIGMLDDVDRVPARVVADRTGDDEQLRYMTRCLVDWPTPESCKP